MELQGAVGLESAVNFRSVHRVHHFSFKSEHEERKSEVVRSVSATKVEGKISSCSPCAFEQNLYLHVVQLLQQKKQNKNPESVQWSRSGREKSRCTEPAELRWRLTVNMLTIRDSSCPSSHILCHTPLTEREEAGWLCCFWLLYAAWYRQDINPTSLFQLSGVMVKTSPPSLKWSGLRLRLRWASAFSHVESVWRPPLVLFWPHPAVHLSELPISFSSLFHFPFHPPPNGFLYRISVISIIPAFICLLPSNVRLCVLEIGITLSSFSSSPTLHLSPACSGELVLRELPAPLQPRRSAKGVGGGASGHQPRPERPQEEWWGDGNGYRWRRRGGGGEDS